MTALEWVQRSKIIAIVRGLPKEYMTRLAEALYAGGIDLMEVTFHQQKPETWKDTAAAIAAAALFFLPSVFYDRRAKREESLTYTILRLF